MTADTDTTDAPEKDAEDQPENDSQQPKRSDIPPEVAAALKKANREAERYRTRLKEIEDRDKTENERHAEARATAERDANEARNEVRRLRVAIAKKLPPELADRLRGDTEEEMAADADSLLKALTPKTTRPASFDGGAKTTAPAGTDMNALIRQRVGLG